MAPSARVQSAFHAMKEIGIPETRTKPVLKKLLKLYEKNWKLIEEENYRVLADAIFEDDTDVITEDKNVPDNPGPSLVANVLEQEPHLQEESERPLKRLRRGGATSNAGPSSIDAATALKQPKPEPIDEPQGFSAPVCSQIKRHKSKGKQPMMSNQSEPHKPSVAVAHGLHLKEPTKDLSIAPSSKGKEPANGLIIPKDEPYNDSMPLNAVALDEIRPEYLPEAAPSTANGSSHVRDHSQIFSTCKEQNKRAITVVGEKPVVNGEILASSIGEKEPNGTLDSNNQNLVVMEQQLNSDGMRCLHGSIDISRGEERVQIPLVNGTQKEFVPSFHYIRQNVIYSDASVKLTFSQICDEDYCQTCYGDCLSSSKQHACLCAKDGEFAYTSEGLLKETFLEECMSIVRNPQKHNFFHCSTCPHEKYRNEGMLEPCKGHIKRTFINECWIKCGCSKICSNRVVQRGITRKLQVFWTPEGKGWGLRTMEELPKGAFVCEYVGEVLTLSERHQRGEQSKSNGKKSYPVVLDSGWSFGELHDNQSICLDLTFYGNAARFLNHRCLDANLVEVPVQVETSDRHYYHIALFTTRKVDAMEELTWDYGMEFDLEDFHCLCGSNFCRNMKRSGRSSRSLSNA